MSTGQAGWSRRLVLFVLVPGLILAGLALVVWGFAMASFALAGLGVALVVAGTLALVAARPQQVDWGRRFGVSLVTIGGLSFLGSLLGPGAFPPVASLVVVAAGTLLLVRRRVTRKPSALRQEAL